MHSPMRTLEATLQVWRVFEQFVSEGKVKHIGLSNCYDPRFFDAVIQQATIKPSFMLVVFEVYRICASYRIMYSQNRFYAQTGYDLEILKLCRHHDITYQSFWTLTANPNILSSGPVSSIAIRRSLTPAQTLFKYLSELGITPLSGTSSAEHATQDVQAVSNEIRLTQEEKQSISALLW